MQKLKLSQVLESVEPLKNLSSIKLPIKIAYQLSRLSIEIDREMKIFNERKDKSIKEHGKTNEENGETSIDKNDIESMKKFIEDMENVLSLEVEINWADKIKLSDLGDIVIEPKNIISWLFE